MALKIRGKIRKHWGPLKPATKVIESRRRYRRAAEKARLRRERDS